MSPLELPQKYLLPASRTDWKELLEDWQPLLRPSSVVWQLTKFGDLIFAQEDGRIGMLQASDFRYEVIARDKIDFQEWLADPEKLADWYLAPLVDRLEANGMQLPDEHCYSFRTPVGLGGQRTIENVVCIPVRSHFQGLGKVFRQVK